MQPRLAGLTGAERCSQCFALQIIIRPSYQTQSRRNSTVTASLLDAQLSQAQLPQAARCGLASASSLARPGRDRARELVSLDRFHRRLEQTSEYSAPTSACM